MYSPFSADARWLSLTAGLLGSWRERAERTELFAVKVQPCGGRGVLPFLAILAVRSILVERRC